MLADDLAKATLDLQTIEAEMAARMLAWRQELALRIDKKPCKSELEELLRFKMDACTCFPTANRGDPVHQWF